jgi:hypothetical protein
MSARMLQDQLRLIPPAIIPRAMSASLSRSAVMVSSSKKMARTVGMFFCTHAASFTMFEADRPRNRRPVRVWGNTQKVHRFGHPRPPMIITWGCRALGLEYLSTGRCLA